MAQTNDEQLFRKVVSKPDFRNTFSNIEKKEILDNRSSPEAWHIKELMLQIAREARLAALHDCKTLAQPLLEEIEKTISTDIRSPARLVLSFLHLQTELNNYKKALAELEALRKKVEVQ